MSTINFDLSAQNFTIDFKVDTSAIQSQNFTFSNGMLQQFVANVPLMNFTETVNGQTVINVPSTSGTFFGTEPVVGSPFLDMGVNADSVPYMTLFSGIPKDSSDLNNILLGVNYGTGLGRIGETNFVTTSFVVTDPVNVSAPWDWIGVAFFCLVLCGMLASADKHSQNGDDLHD